MKKNLKYNSKGAFAVFVIGIFLFSMIPAALAENGKRKGENTANGNIKIKSNAGINPDSALYGLDVALDNIRQLLAANADAKAKVGLEIAEERLAEMREMIQKNKMKEVERANREHEKTMKKVKANISKHKSKPDKEDKELDEIEKHVEKHEREITEVRNNLTISIRAKGNITAEQQSIIDSVLKSLENQTGEVKVKITEKKNEIRINVEIGEEDDENDTEDAEEKREKAKEQIEVAAETIAKARAKLNASAGASNSVIKLIAQADAHLSTARTVFKQGKFGEAFGQANSAEHLAANAIRVLEHKETEEEEKEGKISGIVFNDVNGNGIRNDKDKVIANWTLFLDANNNGAIDSNETTTTTDSEGRYKFDNLAEGRYTIREAVQQGWMTTTPNPVVVRIDEEDSTKINFGNFKLGEIRGVKFEDSNRNGLRDANETPIANWTIKLTGPVDASAVTDSSGAYSFTNLKPGIYTVSEVQQSGWNQTMPRGSYEVNAISGLISIKDFGNAKA